MTNSPTPTTGTSCTKSIRILLTLLPLCAWGCWQKFPALPVLAVLAAAALIAAAGLSLRYPVYAAISPFLPSLRFALAATFSLTAVCLLSRLLLTLLPEWLVAQSILPQSRLIPLAHICLITQAGALITLSLAVCLRLIRMVRSTA